MKVQAFERMTSLRLREEEVLSLVRVVIVSGKTGQVARDAAKVVAVGETWMKDVPTWETPNNNDTASGPTSREEIGAAVFPLALGKPGCWNRALSGSLLADLTLWMKRQGGHLIWTTPRLTWVHCHLYNLHEPRQCQQEHGIVLLMVLRPDTITAEEMAGVGVNDRLTRNGTDTETRKADKDTRFD
ncbi:hypothetical protein BC827DRAFT_1154706 [Russula dissimulans]|nr:hypothetical protein BC827DRAFT_1154706 [Russula dissimulans]